MPPIGRVTVLAWPGIDLAVLLGPRATMGRARREDADLATLDSADRCLARAGIAVSKSKDHWVVDIAGYGSATVGGASTNRALPDEDLLLALSSVTRGRILRYSVRERRRGRVFPLLSEVTDETTGETTARQVGFLRDEQVHVVEGRRIVSDHRHLTIEAETWVIQGIRRRLKRLGMISHEVRDGPLSVPLASPDPAPWPLERIPDTRTILQRALANAVGELLRHDPVVRLDLHSEGVHRARGAIRALRSVLSAFEELFDGLPDSLPDDLRWISGLLGQVRDLDVLAETLGSVIEETPVLDREQSNFLFEELAGDRAKRLTDLRTGMSSTRYARLVVQLVALGDSPAFAKEAELTPERALVPTARRSYRRLRKCAKAATGKETTAVAVHAVRLSAKRFRSVLDTLAEAVPDAAAHTTSVAQLQQVLGRFNDVVTAEQWLSDRAESEADPARAFVLGVLATKLHRRGDRQRSRWLRDWARVKSPGRVAWLED